MKQSLIDKAVSRLGYKRIKSLVYRASFSTKDVEHFLAFSFWGGGKTLLQGKFGLRNDRAELFGSSCVRKYGGEVYKLLKVHTFCAMGFPLGELLGWPERSSLNLLTLTDHEVQARIAADLEYRLLPLVQPIGTLDAFLHILQEDRKPFRWLYVNGAIRAAQVACLAHQLGLPRPDIYDLLRPYKTELVASLARGTDPEWYLDRVIGDLGSPDEAGS